MTAQEEYLNGGITPKNKQMSVADFLDYWMENYCRVNLKETTQIGYEKKIRLHLKPSLGGYVIGSITPLVLQNFINQMFEAGYSRNSLSVVKGVLSGAFSYAVSPAGFLATNPMLTVRLPNVRAKSKTPTRRKTRSFLTTEEWERLIARFPEGHSCHLPLRIGYHLGLRLGEAFALLWEDVDFDKQTIIVRRQVQWNQEGQCWFFSEPKYGSSRTISFDPLLGKILRKEQARQLRGKEYYAERYIQIRVDEQGQLGTIGQPIHLINVREDGSYIQPRTTQHLNAIAHTQLGLPTFDYHTLRHTHATMLLEAGVNPVDIQERLGHSKLTMTWRYAHNTDAIRQTSTAIIGKLFACP